MRMVLRPKTNIKVGSKYHLFVLKTLSPEPSSPFCLSFLILSLLSSGDSVASTRTWWVEDVTAMLLSPEPMIRQRAEEYLMVKLLKRDKASVPELLCSIRVYNRCLVPSHRRIWALLVVGRYAR